MKNDNSALHAGTTMVALHLDETDASAAEVGSVNEPLDQFRLHASLSLEEASIPQGIHFLLDDEDSIRFHRSGLAEGSRLTIGEHEETRFGMRGIRPSRNLPMSHESEPLDLDDISRSEEQEEDLSSVTTEESVDFEEFEVDLNDEPGSLYRSIQGSCNFYSLALS